MEIVVLFFFCLTVTGAEIEGPQNTLSVVGSTAILKCSPPSTSCNETEWLKYTSGRSLMILDPSGIITKDYRDRYSVDGSSGCDLVIRHVRLADAGLFICRAYISSNSVEKTAHLIILDTQPKCARNASLNDTVEGDGVHLTCEVTFNGTNRASMVWEGVADAPDAVKTGNTIRRSHLVAAIAPEVPSFTCNTSFVVATRDSTTGAPIMGTATNMPVVTCETPAIKVKFSARNVKLIPTSSVYSSGTIITCAAEGYPAPSFKWQTRELENNATWHDIPNAKQRVFAQCFAGLSQFRCIATNVVRGEPQTAMSTVFQIMQSEITGDFTSTAAIRPTSEDHLGVSTGGGTLGGIVCDIGIGIGIGVGIGFLAAILLASIVFVILVRVKMIEFNRRRANKPLDDVVLPMKQESHHLAVAYASTRALLVGEQESAYASLGQDRQANEYASFKERQKTKHDRKSKI